jgi:hypothetical protein
MKKLSLTIFAIFLFMIFHSTASADIGITYGQANFTFYSSMNLWIFDTIGSDSLMTDVTSIVGNACTNCLQPMGIYKGTYPDTSNQIGGGNGRTTYKFDSGFYGGSASGYYPLSSLTAGDYFYEVDEVDTNSSGQVIDTSHKFIFPYHYDGTTMIPANITPPTPPSCTDGIQNQGETGIDMGGPCFYVSLNWPTDISQVPDFAQWTVAYYGNDTAINTATMQKAVMWSDDKTLLDSCLNYPSSTATYASCFALADPVHIDFGMPLYISLPTHSEFIDKIGTMTPAKTYYAKALLYSVNDTSLDRENLLSYGSDISFTIDNSVGTNGGANKCTGIDLGCILQTVFRWAFIPTQASLSQFSNFGTFLKSKAPFGYANEVYTQMTTITYNADETPTVIIPQVQAITDNIFTPIRNGLDWVLWFLFGFYLFKRFKDIDI